jgi:SagB-type dehydrogenase family enzyme
MGKDLLEQYRYFLKDSVRLTIDFYQTAQSRLVPPPPVEKAIPEGSTVIDLIPPDACADVNSIELARAIARRRSHRAYASAPLSLGELSFLLWATQGVRKKVDPAVVYRTVPSAGCRHALETYLCVLNVTGLEAGIYRYLPLEHKLLYAGARENLSGGIVDACLGQPSPGKAAVTFVWTAIPYRMEWRYDIAAHKVILLDAGHVCQNLYLACEAIGSGTCAIAAYHQERADELLEVDGKEEFVIYLAPVGKV